MFCICSSFFLLCIQYSRYGLWGRGLYFAEQASYSYRFAYDPSLLRPASDNASFASMGNRSQGLDDEREMFMVKLNVGEHIELAQDPTLSVPPLNETTGNKYNTVSGTTQDAHVFIVYENGRAYPEYLVRFYRGGRDTDRTPFATREEAQHVQSIMALRNITACASTEQATEARVVWRFQDASRIRTRWLDYPGAQHKVLEQAYEAFSNDPAKATVTIQGPKWKYEIDFVEMKQTNLGHRNHTRRAIIRDIISEFSC